VVAVLMAVGLGPERIRPASRTGWRSRFPPADPEVPPTPITDWYGWHRPWGFGIFFPFFFVFLWLVVLRGSSGGASPVAYYRHWDDMPSRFDEWHRRAHEQMRPDASSPTHSSIHFV
jgi:hypothetical protein